jgi:hypothetical protein
MIAHTASGLRSHGFREHKSPAIYAYFMPLSLIVLLQASYETRVVCNTEVQCLFIKAEIRNC